MLGGLEGELGIIDTNRKQTIMTCSLSAYAAAVFVVLSVVVPWYLVLTSEVLPKVRNRHNDTRTQKVCCDGDDDRDDVISIIILIASLLSERKEEKRQLS